MHVQGMALHREVLAMPVLMTRAPQLCQFDKNQTLCSARQIDHHVHLRTMTAYWLSTGEACISVMCITADNISTASDLQSM